MSLTKTYPLEVETNLWDRIKATVPRDLNLNNEIVRRVAMVSFGETYERKGDSRGRISVPGAENEDVEVLVVKRDELPDLDGAED